MVLFNGKRNRGMSLGLRIFLVALSCHASLPARAEEKLTGTKPPEWKVVLVRWWTAPGCPYCKATAPALNEFYREYRGRGLEVIGFYHHKSDGPLRVEEVKKYSRQFGFKFPVAIDPEWRTLKQWWLDTGDRDFTSVSFLLDRQGVIRHIHPGGQYVKGEKAYAELKAKIEGLLAEK